MDREFIKRIKEKNVFFIFDGGLCICNVYFSMMNFLHVSYLPDGGRCEHLSVGADRQDNNGRRDDQEICQEKKSDVMGFIVSSDFIIQFY